MMTAIGREKAKARRKKKVDNQARTFKRYALRIERAALYDLTPASLILVDIDSDYLITRMTRGQRDKLRTKVVERRDKMMKEQGLKMVRMGHLNIFEDVKEEAR